MEKENLEEQIATLQAERDRLRNDVLWLTQKADDERNGRKAAESQLAEARKVLKATLTSIEKFCEALAKSNNQVCVEAVAEITSCAINLKASLSQPTTPPAVPSEEEVARIIGSEREACAKIAEHHGKLVGDNCWNHENRRIGLESTCWDEIAKDIRARQALPAEPFILGEEPVAKIIYENAFDCKWAETDGIERDLWLQVSRAVLALLKGE